MTDRSGDQASFTYYVGPYPDYLDGPKLDFGLYGTSSTQVSRSASSMGTLSVFSSGETTTKLSIFGEKSVSHSAKLGFGFFPATISSNLDDGSLKLSVKRGANSLSIDTNGELEVRRGVTLMPGETIGLYGNLDTNYENIPENTSKFSGYMYRILVFHA